jgi:HPt (histidine-containing phosphotransfer) domain-containing protein
MKGDRERCLAAGMDAYVAKPIRERELVRALEQVLRSHAPGVFSRPLPPASRKTEVRMAEDFDRAAALDRCGDDAGLLRELIVMFLAEIPGWMRDLESAVSSGHAEQIKRLAHTIKGAVGTFGTGPAYQASMRLEMLAKEGNPGQAAEVYRQLEQLLDRLKETLAKFES